MWNRMALFAAILVTLTPCLSQSAESIMAVKKTGEYQQQLVAPSALDRDAVRTARAALMEHALEQDEGLYLYGVIGNFIAGDNIHLLIEFKKPIKWIAEPRVLTDVDRLNGLEWVGTIHMDGAALRVADPTDRHGHFATATWGAWRDAHYSYQGNMMKGHVTTDAATTFLQKQNGAWSSGNPQTPKILWTAHTTWQGVQMFLSPPPAENLPGGAGQTTSVPGTTPERSTGETSPAVASFTPSQMQGLLGTWSATQVRLNGKVAAKGTYTFVQNGNTLKGEYQMHGFPRCQATLEPQSASPPNYVFSVHVTQPLLASLCSDGSLQRIAVNSADAIHVDQVSAKSGQTFATVELKRQ